ncbi:MAG: hypothetical protein MZW92_73245 [Comamonadaceae bacterium]|nr:hypothetical protein [Comamonadaceae bacterium]
MRHALALVPAGPERRASCSPTCRSRPSLYEVVTAHDAEVIDAGARRRRRRPAGAGRGAARGRRRRTGRARSPAAMPATLLVDLVENYGCDAVVMGARRQGTSVAARCSSSGAVRGPRAVAAAGAALTDAVDETPPADL